MVKFLLGAVIWLVSTAIVCGLLFIMAAFAGNSWQSSDWHWVLRLVFAYSIYRASAKILEEVVQELR